MFGVLFDFIGLTEIGTFRQYSSIVDIIIDCPLCLWRISLRINIEGVLQRFQVRLASLAINLNKTQNNTPTTNVLRVCLYIVYGLFDFIYDINNSVIVRFVSHFANIFNVFYFAMFINHYDSSGQQL